MHLTALPRSVHFEDEDDSVFRFVARQLKNCDDGNVQTVKGAIEASSPVENPQVEEYRNLLLQEFKNSSLSGIYPIDPPVRGPFGEAEIWLKPNAKPVAVPPFRLTGERERAHAELVQQAIV